MARILIISRYYLPEIGVAGVCISETAKRLAARGHQVTVLTTFPNYPTGIVPPEYRGHIIRREVYDGVQVIRVWCYIAPNKGFFLRILAQLSFGFLAPLLGWRDIDRPDIIIVGSPPLFNVIAGRVLAWLKRCPLIFRVDDLWPESAVQLGMLHSHLLIRLSEWLEWSTYQRARFVWVVTEGIRDTLIRRGLPAERIFLLTNGVDTDKFLPLPKAQVRAELGWDDRFTIVYAGNHGLAYGLTSVLDAAEQLRDYTDIHFIFVGNGVKKAHLVELAHRRNLKNVTFLDAVPHDRVPLLLAGADVCLIPLRKLSLLEGSLPVKMFEIMASARPFILGGEGIARRIAEQEAGAAISVEPENVDALVSAVLHLYEHQELAEALGRQGRAFVLDYFDYNHLVATLDTHLAKLLQNKEPASAISASFKNTVERS